MTLVDPLHNPARTRRLIDQLLAERNELLVRFCRIAGLEPPLPQLEQRLEMLREFCQVLVDYTALFQFELLAPIEAEAELPRSLRQVFKRTLSGIEDATHLAVEFNDKYDPFDDADAGVLSGDLSRLGEALAARFELENELFDALLEAVTTSNKIKPAQASIAPVAAGPA